jgi:hypothetical protein
LAKSWQQTTKDQGSEDTKEAGETGDEEQKADEKDGEGTGPAALTTTAENGGGGGARSFSSPPVDRTHHSSRGKRRMSDQEERDEETRLELERVQEEYDNSQPKGVWTGTEEAVDGILSRENRGDDEVACTPSTVPQA